MSEPYTAMHVGEVPAVDPVGRTRWSLIREHFGISSFGVNAYTAGAGETVISEHDEAGDGSAGHEELYVVLAGHATFTVGVDEVDAPHGTLVFVRDAKAKRKAVAVEAGTTVLVVGGVPGIFEPSRFERSAAAFRYWNEDWDRAIELLAKAHKEHPDDATLLYNLACAEAQRGDRDDALGHLARALELQSDLRENVADDPDLGPLRDDPAFPKQS